jgi:hypothetical protein
MKKIIFYLLSFCILLSAFSLYAQQIQFPDSNFETGWISKDGQNGPYLGYETEYFYTLNRLYGLPNDPLPADLTAFREEVNVQSGKYCIKLVSGVVPVGENLIFLPGMVGTINQGFVDEFLNTGGNVTITKYWDYDTPHALEGWYRYNPVNGDSALIDIGLDDYDKPIYLKNLIIEKPTSEWTHFSIEIPEQYWNDYFKRIRVLFVASAGVNFTELQTCKGQKGSTLWIDNISLRYTNGIKQNLFSSLKTKTFPNPATEVVHVELNEPFAGKIVVYDTFGRTILEENINGTQCQFTTSTLPSGNYFYRLINENTIFAQDKFVVTK